VERYRCRPQLLALEDRCLPSLIITTVAGTGTAGFNGDNQPATSAQLNGPVGVAVDAQGNLFIADFDNNRVREVVKATGQIITVAGTGTAGFNGDNQPATSAYLNGPVGVAVDAQGNLFIGEFRNQRIREVVKATGQIITVAGTGTASFNGDNQPANSAQLNRPSGVAVDAQGNLFIADRFNQRVREVVKATGQIITVAGTGTFGFNGDNQLATSAQLLNPLGVAVDAQGNLFIADTANNRVRKVAAPPLPPPPPPPPPAHHINPAIFVRSFHHR
jgi:adhesin/invasin